MLLHTPLLRWRYLFLGLLLISCSPLTPVAKTAEASFVVQTTSTPTLPIPSSTQKLVVTVRPTLPISEAITQTPVATSTYPQIEADLRISYITYLYNGDELLSTKIWVLYPPYRSPQLLYSTGNGNQDHIISPLFWSHNNRQVAFAHFVGDESHFAFSIFDTITKQVISLTEVFAFRIVRPYSNEYDIQWSFDDKWISLEYFDFFQFSNAMIVNIESKKVYSLDYATQDEFAAWSPIIFDEYAYISRKNYPDPGGDVLCIGKAEHIKPLRCTEKFNILNSGNTFSWSNGGQKALITASNDTEFVRYLMLDLNSMQWSPFLTVSEGYSHISRYWSPDDQFIVFYGHGGLHLLNTSDNKPKLNLVSDFERARPVGWLSDGRVLIFQADYGVYTINPHESSDVGLVDDFTTILKDKTLQYQIDIMKNE